MTREESGGDGKSTPASLSSDSPLQLPRARQLPPGTLSGRGGTIERPGSQWNTSKLGLRVGADLAAAGCASLLVAPVVTIIDRSIIEKAAAGGSIRQFLFKNTLPLLLRPHKFVFSRPFFLISLLYFSTYATANAIDTASSTVHSQPPKTVTSGPAKFFATSMVNMSLCVYKDSVFAKAFGPPTPPGQIRAAIPKISYALFAARDSMTIFASFNLPPLIAPALPTLSEKWDTEARRASVAQFLAPAGMQLFSTPIHLLGLDLFNRQGRLSWIERWARVKRDWLVSAFARMGRIIPAFGVGGVVNANVRRTLMEQMEE